MRIRPASALLALLLVACTTVNVPAATQTIVYQSTTEGASVSNAEYNAKRHSVMMGNNSCTATKVGPHTLLTATHCIDDDDTVRIEEPKSLMIDGNRTSVKRYVHDGYDHTLIEVNDTYNDYAHVARRPAVGANVFVWGNSEFDEILRRGYIVGYQASPSRDAGERWPGEWMLIDLLIAGGDSGSAVFNQQGEVVGVISFVYSWDNRGSGAMARLAASTRFNFDADEIRGLVPYPAPLTGK